MASGPDLFVICKQCGAEVSPYITECPYCGTRLRKRAPDLTKHPLPKRRRHLWHRRINREVIEGISIGTTRPYGTIVLIAGSVLLSLAARSTLVSYNDVALVGKVPLDFSHSAIGRLLTTQFVYTNTGYEVAVLATVALFGWLLERRHGILAPLLVFLIGGTAGMVAINEIDQIPTALGGNGGALALVAAWSMRDLIGRLKRPNTLVGVGARNYGGDDSDLLGVLAFVVLLLLLSLATTQANPIVGLVGGAVGIFMGTLLTAVAKR